jgi:hypothetical protein
MPSSLFSPLGPRFCQWCQAPLQGRSDQKFCRANCRNMARRHGTEDCIDWPARAAAAEQLASELQAQLDQQAQVQLVAQPYEQRYEDLSRLLGTLAQHLQDGNVLSSYTYFVGQLLDHYQQHPGLATGEAPAQRRLASLQQLHTDLRAHYQTLLAQQQQMLLWQQQQQHQQDAAQASPPASPVPLT